ncbi:hypothetical protein AB6A40_004785 [Gnathostoma spinigerum]|uniref:Secreted protein n=1 Tax=Gnathostoma spinigerum TaxID=75299 RepID=A0ABD6EFV7_9BILA
MCHCPPIPAAFFVVVLPSFWQSAKKSNNVSGINSPEFLMSIDHLSYVHVASPSQLVFPDGFNDVTYFSPLQDLFIWNVIFQSYSKHNPFHSNTRNWHSKGFTKIL